MAIVIRCFCKGGIMERISKEDVISEVDDLYPNTFEYMNKAEWIDEIERRIEQEIINNHENPDKRKKGELYAPKPYKDIYVYYLESKIDKNNMEYDRYNNHMTLFNNIYAEFAAYYNRTHMPLSHGKFKV